MIELQDVTKRYGEVVAVHGVSLAVPAGHRVAVLGPSGCGKTTLLRVAVGLEAPDAGRVTIDGRLVSGDGVLAPPHTRGCGLVFQDGALFPHMTVEANVAYGVAGSRAEVAERVAATIADAGLDGLEGRYPSQLSGGQRRRVAIARALAPAPARLLMDEPFTNLDRAARDELLAATDRLVTRSGASLLLVTHDADEATALRCDLVRMERGRRVG